MENSSPLSLFPGDPSFWCYPVGMGINFAIAAKDAQKLSLCLFDENNPVIPFKEIELNPHLNKTGDVWHVRIEGLPPFILYGYRSFPIRQQKDPSSPRSLCKIRRKPPGMERLLKILIGL